jgi:hypothetical protein
MFGGQRSDLTNLNWLLKIDLARGYKISRMTGGNLLELPSLEGHEMASIGKSIYIFGGFEGGIVQKCSSKFIKIDPLDQRFEVVSMGGYNPAPRMNFASCLDSNGRIIYFGGSDNGEKLRDLFAANLETKEFQLLNIKAEPKGIEGHQMVYHPPTGNFLVFGGVCDNIEENSRVFLLDKFGHKTVVQEESVEPSLVGRESPGGARLPSPGQKKQRSRSASIKIKVQETTNRSKQFFLKTKKELDEYEKDFINLSDKQRHKYLADDHQTKSMKDALKLLGVYTTDKEFRSLMNNTPVNSLQSTYHNSFAYQGKNTRRVSIVGRKESLEAYQQETGRPLPREGHCLVYGRGKLVVVAGMRHTFALHDVTYISEENLKLVGSKGVPATPQDRSSMDGLDLTKPLLPFFGD